jgi:hypothetical protein
MKLLINSQKKMVLFNNSLNFKMNKINNNKLLKYKKIIKTKNN